ncbi:MAG: diaminopimelate epimerase [Planctomycetes bacterium]|nr:diaminopimelate epimerase [Planctomycetota bacterium]
MTRIPFVKMEGAGNDYVYVDAIGCDFPIEVGPECARRWSDRHFGIGADGLIVLARGDAAPVRMLMWNADGSRAAMCGNGLRCLAALAFANGHVQERAFSVETDSGPRPVTLLDGDRVRTGMGAVSCGDEVELALPGRLVRYRPGDAGNPHAVIFVDDVDRAEVAAIGAAMQSAPVFRDGVNVEFVAVAGPSRLRQRTFERGSGETMACGTGAAVAALAARVSDRVVGDAIDVELRGGVLRIVLGGTGLAIEGPVRTVFRGDIELPE